jgi:hypothetical protein
VTHVGDIEYTIRDKDPYCLDIRNDGRAVMSSINSQRFSSGMLGLGCINCLMLMADGFSKSRCNSCSDVILFASKAILIG